MLAEQIPGRNIIPGQRFLESVTSTNQRRAGFARDFSRIPAETVAIRDETDREYWPPVHLPPHSTAHKIGILRPKAPKRADFQGQKRFDLLIRVQNSLLSNIATHENPNTTQPFPGNGQSEAISAPDDPPPPHPALLHR